MISVISCITTQKFLPEFRTPKSNIYLGESFFDQIMFILFWLSLMVGSILHVIRNGPEYVNQPLLVQTLIRDK